MALCRGLELTLAPLLGIRKIPVLSDVLLRVLQVLFPHILHLLIGWWGHIEHFCCLHVAAVLRIVAQASVNAAEVLVVVSNFPVSNFLMNLLFLLQLLQKRLHLKHLILIDLGLVLLLNQLFVFFYLFNACLLLLFLA